MEAVGLLFAGFGALIWFGGWRSWAQTADPLRCGVLGAPWLGLGFLLLDAGLLLRWLGVVLPTEVVPWLMGVPGIIGLSVGTFGWPDWAKPPWYREFERLEQEARDRDATSD